VLGSFNYLASAELYSPATGTWALTGSMSTPRIAHTATLLPNGQVLVAGGDATVNGSFTIFSSAELYNPATGTDRRLGDGRGPGPDGAGADLATLGADQAAG
jgi:hypothetical protein